MRIGLKTLFATLLIIPFLLGLSRTAQYSTLSDIPFAVSERVGDIGLYRPTKTTYNAEFIRREVGISDMYFKSFAAAHNLPLESCNNVSLYIFVVDMDVINDLDRYPTTKNQVIERWALYDSYKEDRNLSAIMVTDHADSTIDKVLLTHELGHYWYDKYCLADNWNGTTESFAMAFQNFYSVSRYDRRY